MSVVISSLIRRGGGLRPILFSVSVLCLLSVGCAYDYAALNGGHDAAVPPGPGEIPGSGGTLSNGTRGIAGMGEGASGGTPGTGGSTGLPVASGGQIAATTGGQPATTGGTDFEAGGGGVGTDGVGVGGGADISPFSVGDTGGQGTGGADNTPAAPRILSVDFVGGYTMAVSTGGAGGAGTTLVSLAAMSPTEIAGFKPASHWNAAFGAAGSLTGIALADASATEASVMWNSPPSVASPGEWRVGYTDAPGDARMMNGYLDPLTSAAPATVVVSGLPTTITSAGYDVYVYTSGAIPSGTRTYRYAIGATTFTVSQTGPTPTTFSGYVLAPAGGAGNYVVFRNRTEASFTLIATPGTGSPSRSPVNGIQIVSPTGS